MKKVYIIESCNKPNNKLYLHTLAEEFYNFVNENAHVSIVTLTENSEAQICAAIASACLSQDEAVMVGIKAMVTHTNIGLHLIEMLESQKEFAN